MLHPRYEMYFGRCMAGLAESVHASFCQKKETTGPSHCRTVFLIKDHEAFQQEGIVVDDLVAA